MSLVPALTHLVAPWAKFYGDSKLVATGVTFAHVGGLLLGGGYAVAADRNTLRFKSTDPILQRHHLEQLGELHRPVLIGLAVSLVSGLLLLASDLETFLPTVQFWLKMGLIVVLLINGRRLQLTEGAMRLDAAPSATAWQRLRRAATVSLILWFLITLLGTALEEL